MKKLIGNKKFYLMVLAVAVPIMIQNGITNFVGLLDNIMVGRIGTEQMSGVAIVNQLLLVFNICVFGGISGAGIFTAQFHGCGDNKGVRDTFRIKLVLCLGILFAGLAVFLAFGEPLIRLYLHEENGGGDIEATLGYAMSYLKVMLVGIVPYAIVQAYSSTLRETGETMLPMKAGIVAVLVNLVLNYILIYGKLGFPSLGVVGAAIATDISRYVEMLITVIWTHTHKEREPFIVGAYKHFRIPAHLAGQVVAKGTPLMVNEALWSAGQAVLMQCYSVRGLSVIAALNISSTISNVFNVVFLAMGNSIAIIVGQLLGAGKMEEAKDTDRKLIFFSVASCVFIGLLMAGLSPVFPMVYNTGGEVKGLATGFILIAACCMPMYAFMHATYFTLRSGGKTMITFLFDSVYVWAVDIPLAFILTRYTGMPIRPIYLCCQLIELLKCVLGYILVKKGIWLHNMVKREEAADSGPAV